jgi:hypothetical protein
LPEANPRHSHGINDTTFEQNRSRENYLLALKNLELAAWYHRAGDAQNIEVIDASSKPGEEGAILVKWVENARGPKRK